MESSGLARLCLIVKERLPWPGEFTVKLTQAGTHGAAKVEPILMEGAWNKTVGEPESNDSNSNRRSQDEAKDN